MPHAGKSEAVYSIVGAGLAPIGANLREKAGDHVVEYRGERDP